MIIAALIVHCTLVALTGALIHANWRRRDVDYALWVALLFAQFWIVTLPLAIWLAIRDWSGNKE